MIKQAIARHYFIKDHLHYRPLRTVHVESEKYTIRLLDAYDKAFPKAFLADPENFIETQSTELKSSRGEGPYPEEQVVSFVLDNGTEVIAKRIELRKTKQATKEFMILLAAEKAGLDTAKPIGFVTGKDPTDGSYLLMKKIEGISGRHFEEYLRNLDSFPAEKIKEIMATVLDQLRAQAIRFREKLHIDKHWRIKDTIIRFNESTGTVDAVIPIDWERAKDYNATKPKEID